MCSSPTAFSVFIVLLTLVAQLYWKKKWACKLCRDDCSSVHNVKLNQSEIHLCGILSCHRCAHSQLQPLCLFTCWSIMSSLKGHCFAPLTSWPPAASTRLLSGPANIEPVSQGFSAPHWVFDCCQRTALPTLDNSNSRPGHARVYLCVCVCLRL